jgi:hypothetical protein
MVERTREKIPLPVEISRYHFSNPSNISTIGKSVQRGSKHNKQKKSSVKTGNVRRYDIFEREQ